MVTLYKSTFPGTHRLRAVRCVFGSYHAALSAAIMPPFRQNPLPFTLPPNLTAPATVFEPAHLAQVGSVATAKLRIYRFATTTEWFHA